MTTSSLIKRMLTGLAVLLVTALLCSAAAVGFALWYVSDSARLQSFVEKTVTSATDRTLKFNGNLEVLLGPELTVRADNVDWLNPPWSTEPVMLHFDKVDVSVDVYSFLKEQITITRGRIDGATLVFEWVEGKPMNWDMGDPNSPPSDTPLAPIPLALLQAELNNVQLKFIHPALPEAIVLDIRNATEVQSPNNGLSIEAALALNGADLQLQGDIGPFPELVIAGDVDYELAITSANARLRSLGGFENLANLESPNIELQLTAPEMAELLKTLKLKPVTTGPVEIDGKLFSHEKTIDFQINGHAGAFNLDALLKTTDLSELSDLTLRLSADGPSAKTLGQLASIDSLPDSPFKVDIAANQVAEGVKLNQLSASTLGIAIEASGLARQLPELRDFDLQLEMSAASFSTLGDIAGVDGLPDLPFTLSAQTKAAKGPLNMIAGTVKLGGTGGSFTTGISREASLTGSTLVATITSKDAREIGRYYGLNIGAPLPLTLQLDAVLDTDGVLLNPTQLTLAGNDASASGHIRFSPELALKLQGSASGQNLNEAVNSAIASPDSVALPAKPWKISGDFGFDLPKKSLTVTTSSMSVGNDKLGFDGSIKLETTLPDIDAVISASGKDLSDTLLFLKLADIPAQDYAVKTQFKLSGDGIRLSDIDAKINDDAIKGNVTSDWPEKPEDIVFDIVMNGTNLRETLPVISGYIPPDSPYDLNALGEYSAETIRLDNLAATLGDAKLLMKGSIDVQPSSKTQKITVELSGPRLSDLGALDNMKFRDVPFSLSATVTGQRDNLLIKDLVASIENSDVRGIINIDLRSKTTISAKVTGKKLDLNNLLDDIGQQPTKTTDNVTATKQPLGIFFWRRNRDDRVLSSTPIDYSALQLIDARFALLFDEFSALDKTVQNFDVVGTLNGGVLDVPIVRGDTKYGNLDGMLDLDTTKTPPSVKTSFSATGVILTVGDLDDEDSKRLPRHNVTSELSTEGASPQDMAAALSGYFWLEGSNGMVPTGSLSLLFGDLLTQVIETVNPFTKKQAYSPIACDAVYFEILDGLAQTSPAMILQTDRLSVVAAGTINLKNEKIDIGFRTSPLKGIGVSASDLVNPFIKVGGNLAKPVLTLDPTSTAIQGGAAFFTMGASLLATSLWNRWISSKDACKRMGEEATKIRKKIDSEHVPKMPPRL